MGLRTAVSKGRSRTGRVTVLCDGRQQPFRRAAIGCCRRRASMMQVCELKTDRYTKHLLVAVSWIRCCDETGRLRLVRKCDLRLVVTIRETLDADVRRLTFVRVLGWRSGCFGVIGAGFRVALSIDENEARWCDVVRCQRARVEEHAVDGARPAVDLASFAPNGLEARCDKPIEISQLGELRTTD